MAKIIENTQRDINISFINEVVMICNKLKDRLFSSSKISFNKMEFP